MCGIAGALFWDEGEGAEGAEAVVRRMSEALAHRGPDKVV
jgi:asparagine synthetase B (glutamine-hydrolysing)